MEEKEKIRREALAKRKSLSEEETVSRSRAVVEKLVSLPEYIKAEHLLVYVDCRKEVITRGLIRRAWEDGKKTAVPKCTYDRMDFFEICDFSELAPGRFGIPEPAAEKRADWEDALMIMPGAAFDRSLHRIGYGGGYYDRYLSEHPSHFRIALAFDLQLYDRIPFDKHDIPPQLIITEREILKSHV